MAQVFYPGGPTVRPNFFEALAPLGEAIAAGLQERHRREVEAQQLALQGRQVAVQERGAAVQERQAGVAERTLDMDRFDKAQQRFIQTAHLGLAQRQLDMAEAQDRSQNILRAAELGRVANVDPATLLDANGQLTMPAGFKLPTKFQEAMTNAGLNAANPADVNTFLDFTLRLPLAKMRAENITLGQQGDMYGGMAAYYKAGAKGGGGADGAGGAGGVKSDITAEVKAIEAARAAAATTGKDVPSVTVYIPGRRGRNTFVVPTGLDFWERVGDRVAHETDGTIKGAETILRDELYKTLSEEDKASLKEAGLGKDTFAIESARRVDPATGVERTPNTKEAGTATINDALEAAVARGILVQSVDAGITNLLLRDRATALTVLQGMVNKAPAPSADTGKDKTTPAPGATTTPAPGASAPKEGDAMRGQISAAQETLRKQQQQLKEWLGNY